MAATATQAVAAPIVVSCYRGPWSDVIWDRPNAVFIDSLREAGYSILQATTIGDAVCQDPELVSNPDGLKATMLDILKETPPE